ncbi:MAG: YraN family protein [Firmicutes bacterium]|nr:YraN family protein [Bacillota bacterium]
MYKKNIGTLGEKFVADYLSVKGYSILAMDYRLKFGQVDIIARDYRGIHFIEVKTRSGTKYGRPAEAVDRRKLDHIRNVASFYMKANKVDEPIIIDVVEVLVNHIEGV